MRHLLLLHPEDRSQDSAVEQAHAAVAQPGALDLTVHLLPGARGPVSSVAWSPDRTRLATGGADGLHVWNAVEGLELRTLIPLKDGWAVLGSDGIHIQVRRDCER